MPDLRQLRAFVAVAEQSSFTRAARLLHLQQQSVSKTVRELERELGVELLERTTREVHVTQAGAALLESGRDVLRTADAAFARAREVGGGVAGLVRIGTTPPVGPTDVGDAVAALQATGPDVSVQLLELRPGDLHRALRAGEVDLVLARVAGVRVPGLDRAELRPTPLALCVAADHPLAAEGPGAVALARIDGERLLTASAPGTPYTDLLLARCAEAGAGVTHVEARVTGGSALPAQVARAGAVALVPTGTPPAPGTVVLALEDAPTVPLLVLWPTGMPPAAVRRVRDAMTAS
jgi:DNA-binding transcriptional LysR family regulator